MSPPVVREAGAGDLGPITEIYNRAVLETTATFDVEPRTAEQQRDWFARHGGRHPILVAESGGAVLGWSALSPWSDRCAYEVAAEISVYVAEAWRGRGVGKALARAALAHGARARLHTVLARVESGNTASIAMLHKLGFRTVGVMEEVGSKFGRLLDVTILQRILED